MRIKRLKLTRHGAGPMKARAISFRRFLPWPTQRYHVCELPFRARNLEHPRPDGTEGRGDRPLCGTMTEG
jgi:hypothetical protein